MKIQTFTFNPFQENTYLLYDDSGECVVVDAGCYEKHEQEELKRFIKDHGLKPVKNISTHGHIDHVLGNDFVCREFGVDLYVYEKDVETHLGVKAYAPVYGFPGYTEKQPDQVIAEGTERIGFGNTELQVIFAPGHAPGHVVYFHPPTKQLIGGDVLFQRSIGRTDLPGGDYDTLIASIHEKIFPLGNDVVVHPGHGPATTIGEEKRENPFCAIINS